MDDAKEGDASSAHHAPPLFFDADISTEARRMREEEGRRARLEVTSQSVAILNEAYESPFISDVRIEEGRWVWPKRIHGWRG